MKYELLIYTDNSIFCCIKAKIFDSPHELRDLLNKYQGSRCRVIDLETAQITKEGVFDCTFLDEETYLKAEEMKFV